MMQTTQARAGKHRRCRKRLILDGPAIGCVLAETVVHAVLVKYET